MKSQSCVVLDSLRHNLGAVVTEALDNPDIIEVMLNDDGRLWLDSFSKGMIEAGRIERSQATSILNLVASMLGTVVTSENPVVEGELPLDGSRFEGLFPPVVATPTFTIRKKAIRIFTLADYVEQGIMSPAQNKIISRAVTGKNNILVVGGTGSGKTTLTNAILAELSASCPEDRLVIIEDTCELQVKSENKLHLRTNQTTDMRRLLKATMRLRPDRIIVGEVRDGAALDLLKAWNTGHPGGICTVHANSCAGGLLRLQQLISEVSSSSMLELIHEAVDLVIFISKTPDGRQIKELARVNGNQLETINEEE
ncbi:P-type conjugative transfer ATPase TrbB [Desulforhopalus singaporensis]|uniref:Type IV secretion system protein VirB11 n=1 Tax=Desulforhopalus singaporensis TaxID=91360 RepID=A0A1H0S2U5_9BACT|nr:P-type conjugative transfer ATPase TrbB [Desulforhopalus singaporensis]SDP36030.1 type IV secretion system protein VirB11 [Desulforhopalus singaporensis]